MKNVYIDCGCNLGQGLLEVNKKHNFLNNDEWDIVLFEANPDIKIPLKNMTNATFYNKAVWIENTKMEFLRTERLYEYTPPNENIGMKGKPGDMTNVGCRLEYKTISNLNMANKPLTNKVLVEAIDFSQFIKEYSEKKLIIKMDIEGAEYEVLRKMIKDKTVSLIDTLYVETHERFVENETLESTNDLLNKIRKFGVLVHKWV